VIFAALLLLDSIPIVGTVVQTTDGWKLEIEGLKDTAMPLIAERGAPNMAAYKGKRVQVMGESDGKAITYASVDELHPREKDLVLKVTAKGDRFKVLEYLPNRSHRHPGKSCKTHAWVRETIEAKEGGVTREIRIPAYKIRHFVHVFIRVERGDGSADSDDWSFSGEQWIDKELAGIDKTVEITVEAP